MSLKFKFDGAMFFPEQAYDIWEWQSFLHDWLNGLGYVSYFVDYFFVKLMYDSKMHLLHIVPRSSMMILLTWINIIRHKYFVKDLKSIKSSKTISKLINAYLN